MITVIASQCNNYNAEIHQILILVDLLRFHHADLRMVVWAVFRATQLFAGWEGLSFAFLARGVKNSIG